MSRTKTPHAARRRSPRRLFYCRTPLQALIIDGIRRLEPDGEDALLYHPISASPKHRIYFDRLDIADKAFVAHRKAIRPDILNDLVAWPRVPRQFKEDRFDEIYLASIGCRLASLLAAANRRAEFATFDDGLFNLAHDHFWAWIDGEALSHRLLRRLLRAPRNRALVMGVKRHYSLYPPHLSVMRHAEIRSVAVLPPPPAHSSKRPVKIVIGAPIAWYSAATKALYARVIAGIAPDVFVPHPLDTAPSQVADWLPDAQEVRGDIDRLIAEEIIFKLASRGHAVTAFGFGSTVLANVAPVARAVDVLLPEVNGNVSGEMLALGVETVDAETLAAAGPGDGMDASGDNAHRARSATGA